MFVELKTWSVTENVGLRKEIKICNYDYCLRNYKIVFTEMEFGRLCFVITKHCAVT